MERRLPLLIITRRLAKRVRTVFRQALNLPTYNSLPPICLTGGLHGLTIRCLGKDAAAEFHLPGEQPAEQIWIPSQILSDVQGGRDAPVQIRFSPHGITASWSEGSVPQMVGQPSPDPWDDSTFPEPPAEFADNPPGMLKAMQDACETADPDSTRYALGCIQLCGTTGTIVATDGRQLLVQSGFSFPWDVNVLIPKSSVFSCRELPGDEPVRVGRSQQWYIVRVGGWTFWQKPNVDGRFPEVVHHVPAAGGESARLRIAPDDAQFLTRNLPHLTSADEYNLPVTVDLNGQVAVRARVLNQPTPTELRLTGSSYCGDAIRINTNRRYLARAISLGFREISIFQANSPVLAQDDRRQYVWALLTPESAIRPSPETVRIDSHSESGSPSSNPTRRKPKNMTRSTPTSTARSKTDTGPSTPQADETRDSPSTLEHAVALRDSLRQATSKANDLVRALKHDRKQSKALRSTLASLRQIETLEV